MPSLSRSEFCKKVAEHAIKETSCTPGEYVNSVIMSMADQLEENMDAKAANKLFVCALAAWDEMHTNPKETEYENMRCVLHDTLTFLEASAGVTVEPVVPDITSETQH